nr:unnamed protein product [Digitaria exilis]
MVQADDRTDLGNHGGRWGCIIRRAPPPAADSSPLSSDDGKWRRTEGGEERTAEAASRAAMGVMEKLKIFVVKEPVVAASCLIAGFGTRPCPLPPLWPKP